MRPTRRTAAQAPRPYYGKRSSRVQERPAFLVEFSHAACLTHVRAAHSGLAAPALSARRGQSSTIDCDFVPRRGTMKKNLIWMAGLLIAVAVIIGASRLWAEGKEKRPAPPRTRIALMNLIY